MSDDWHTLGALRTHLRSTPAWQAAKRLQ